MQVSMTAAEVIFWGLAALVVYTYFGYPLLVTLVASVWNRPIRREEHTPPVCLIVAAYNEEQVIEEKVRNSLALDYPTDRLKVVIASDGSTDSTHQRVQSFSDPRLQLIARPRRGKTRLLNETIPLFDEPVIVVSDANIELRADALKELMKPLADATVGGAWGNKIYRNPKGSAAGAGESLYLRYEKFIKTQESKIGSIVAGEGSLLAFRREVFRPLVLGIPDDFALSTNVVAAGKRMIYEPRSLSFEDTAPSGRQEFRRKVRIIERGLRGFFHVLELANPVRTGFYAVSLISRQLLRRIVALAYLAMAILLPFLWNQGQVYRVTLAAMAVVLALAAAGWIARGRWRQFSLFFIPYFFCLVNLASLAGMWHLIAGRKSVLWEPTDRN